MRTAGRARPAAGPPSGYPLAAMAYEELLQRIEVHPELGPRLARALREGRELVLEYHRHPAAERWCLALRAGGPDSFEIAHVRDFGRRREDCVPLLGPLAVELRRRYRLTRQPDIHLEGEPFCGL